MSCSIFENAGRLAGMVITAAKSTLDILLDWQFIAGDDDPRWSYTCTLYAYLAPVGCEVLYIGKSDGCSVRTRWREKPSFWRDLEKLRAIKSHRVIVADIAVPVYCRLTRHLLADMESLLIYEVKPWGNIQCHSSRISRPDLKVTCRGAWPLSRKTFRDQ